MCNTGVVVVEDGKLINETPLKYINGTPIKQILSQIDELVNHKNPTDSFRVMMRLRLLGRCFKNQFWYSKMVKPSNPHTDQKRNLSC